MNPTPGRPHGRSGVLAFATAVLVALVGSLPGCEAIESGATIELDSASIDIDGSVHDIRIDGAGATDSIAPSRVSAAPGDAVRFIVDDRRPHALTFTVDSLDPAVRGFLEETGQLRGPPLVNQGAAWVVLLEGAPPGRYPFHCRSHDATGVLTVAAEE